MRRISIIACAVLIVIGAGLVAFHGQIRDLVESESTDPKLHYVTMNMLKADPEFYHQKRIEVDGYWRYGWEEAYLYPSQETVGHYEESIAIDITPALALDAEQFSGRRIIVSGRFISHTLYPNLVPKIFGRIDAVEKIELQTLDHTPRREVRTPGSS